MADDGRKMIYPLTLTQQIKYFPYRFHWKHMSRLKECVIAAILLLPLGAYIERVSKSPANVKNYERYLEREKAHVMAHKHHLEGYYEDQHKH